MADWVGTGLPTRLGCSHLLPNTTLKFKKIDKNSRKTEGFGYFGFKWWIYPLIWFNIYILNATLLRFFFFGGWSCNALARSWQTIKINDIYLFCNMILFKKVRKSKRGQCRKCFPQEKKQTMKFSEGRCTQEIIPFLCQVLFLSISIFFHPPLKLFYPAQVNKFPFQYFIQLADRLRR